ncbi:MAG TPA: IS607 family transposase [Coleofasciculaceae cyanobacterium]|jgi:predicted site-specific integrase-resolvase
MKLSDYAKSQGVSYRTAWNWWKQGIIKGRQLPTGTILVDVENSEPGTTIACIYARVSSSENKSNLDRQAERLNQYAIAKGYVIQKVVKEVGSGLNDNRKKLNAILSDKSFNVLIVEHKDRLTRFGANYIEILLSQTGRRLEVVNSVENNKDDLMTDFAAVITSFCARLYGMRRAKRKTEKLIQELQANGDDETC